MKSCNWSCISQVRWWIGKGTEAIKGRGRYTPTGRCFQRMVLAFEWFDMFWCCYYIDQPYLEMLRWSMFIGCLRCPWKNCILTCVSSIAMLSFSSLQNLMWSHCGKIDHLGTNLIYSFHSHSLIFRGTRWLPSRGRSIKPSICIDHVDRMWSKWRSFHSQSFSMSNHNWALSLMLVCIEWKLYLGLFSFVAPFLRNGTTLYLAYDQCQPEAGPEGILCWNLPIGFTAAWVWFEWHPQRRFP